MADDQNGALEGAQVPGESPGSSPNALVAQQEECSLGKGEVTGSIPVEGSVRVWCNR